MKQLYTDIPKIEFISAGKTGHARVGKRSFLRVGTRKGEEALYVGRKELYVKRSCKVFHLAGPCLC